MKLVIFDLDHTLVDIFRLHDRSFHASMKKVFGLKTCFEEVDFTGKTIGTSIIDAAKLHKVPVKEIKKGVPKALKAYERFFIKNMPGSTKHYLLPSAVKTLKAVQKDHFLALVTADIPELAKQITKRADIYKYFKVRVYGDEAPTRAGLVKKAIRLAKQKGFKGKQVVVIGDSPRDITAGKANKAKVIAVATGTYSIAQLKKAGAHKVFKNLKKVMEAIND